MKPSGQHVTTFGHTLKNVNDDKSVPYLSWGEFTRVEDENIPSLPPLKAKRPSKYPDLKIEVGHTITAAQAFSRSRTRDDAAKPWYPGWFRIGDLHCIFIYIGVLGYLFLYESRMFG